MTHVEALGVSMTPYILSTSSVLVDVAEELLLDRYGTCAIPRDGYSYHNRDHGQQVGAAAYQLAYALHDTNRVPFDTVHLARLAGWWHDAAQGPGHEARSADLAAQAMRQHGLDAHAITTVQVMIRATQVLRVDGHRLIQAADPDNPEQAILADADLSSLGSRDGVWRSLLLGIEQQHHAGQLATWYGEVIPDRDTMLSYLDFQVGLFRAHRYLLPDTQRHFPHQHANSDLADRLRDHYAADRINFAEMLRLARQPAS